MADRFAIVVDGAFRAAYGMQGIKDLAYEQGYRGAIGEDWEEILPVLGVQFDKLPMDEQESAQHNTPVIVDGRVIWTLPNE